MRRILALLTGGVLLLVSCADFTPPAEPSGVVWGVPYTAQVVPEGSLGVYSGYTTGYRVKVQASSQDAWVIAHELTHVWQWQHGTPAVWQGATCSRQPAWHCTNREAQADAVADAALAANCGPGDFGWPAGRVMGCLLPDPASVQPAGRP
jgi:hypothetical protein